MSTLPVAPAYQEYPSDILNNEKFIQMNLAERGLYWTLRMLCWKNESIPSESNQLIAILRMPMSESDFDYLFAPLVSTFFPKHPTQANRLYNADLEKYRKELHEKSKKRSQAGKKGADATWNKSNSNAMVGAIATEKSRAEFEPEIERNLNMRGYVMKMN